jgi:hypothetical protein
LVPVDVDAFRRVGYRILQRCIARVKQSNLSSELSAELDGRQQWANQCSWADLGAGVGKPHLTTALHPETAQARQRLVGEATAGIHHRQRDCKQALKELDETKLVLAAAELATVRAALQRQVMVIAAAAQAAAAERAAPMPEDNGSAAAGGGPAALVPPTPTTGCGATPCTCGVCSCFKTTANITRDSGRLTIPHPLVDLLERADVLDAAAADAAKKLANLRDYVAVLNQASLRDTEGQYQTSSYLCRHQ